MVILEFEFYSFLLLTLYLSADLTMFRCDIFTNCLLPYVCTLLRNFSFFCLKLFSFSARIKFFALFVRCAADSWNRGSKHILAFLGSPLQHLVKAVTADCIVAIDELTAVLDS